MEAQVQSNKKDYNPFPRKDKDNEVATDSVYQSTFLPIFQKAESQIKYLILLYFLTMRSKTELRTRIIAIVNEVSKKIPADLADKERYINGLMFKSNQMINVHYERAKVNFERYVQLVKTNAPRGEKLPKIETPRQLIEAVTKEPKKMHFDMWSEAKAAVRVQDYPKQIQTLMNQLSDEVVTTSETDRKPISLWQKAELDLRHKKQMEAIDNLRSSGVKYAWISSHPDCSKRCEKWQGKLMNIDPNAHSELSGFRMREKLDKNTVYCFQEIASQTDKYGYQNNIIVGFNCRHYFIPYEPGKLPPKEYDAKDVAKQRSIETEIRKKERQIRLLKQREMLYNTTDKKSAAKLQKRIKVLIQKYKRFCEKNGYAWEQYRISV